MNNDTQVTGNIGLYYTCYHLSRMGWNVMPTARNARGVDIIAYNHDCSSMISIQVKTLSKKNGVPLGASLDKVMGDFWVIINNVAADPQTYVMLPKEVKSLAHRREKNNRISYWLPPKAYCAKKFHEAWYRIRKSSRSKSIYECFNEWRKENPRINNWGLAWFLANEFCKRFYSSHGIIPQVISHEGLGYYGIQISKTQCAVHGRNTEKYGRFTMFGNVENWSTGGPGDHGLNAVEIYENGENIESIVKRAIFHMRIPEIPAKTHLNCRHKRWGTSYQLLFEISTILAMKYDHETIEIWNHPYHTQRFIDKLDPKSKMNEHLGAFLFRYKDNEIIFASDGRELSGTQDDNYWHRYMSGESPYDLFENLSQKLKLL